MNSRRWQENLKQWFEGSHKSMVSYAKSSSAWCQLLKRATRCCLTKGKFVSLRLKHFKEHQFKLRLRSLMRRRSKWSTRLSSSSYLIKDQWRLSKSPQILKWNFSRKKLKKLSSQLIKSAIRVKTWKGAIALWFPHQHKILCKTQARALMIRLPLRTISR